MQALSDVQRPAGSAPLRSWAGARAPRERRLLSFAKRVQAPASALASGAWGTPPFEQLTVALPGSVRAGAAARRVVQDMGAAVLSDGERDMLKLLVTELVNNAVEHGGAASAGSVALHLGISFVGVRAEVCDRGPGFDADMLPDRGEGPGGRGLVLLDCFASRWGSTTTDGTCVWFEIDRKRT